MAELDSGYVQLGNQKTYLSGQQYSDAIAAGATPVSDSSITDSNPSANRDKWVNDRLSGLVSPMSQEDISSRLAEQRKANALEAESIFTPKIESAKRLGAAQVSTAEGASGVSQGFNLSTARLSLINNVQNQVQDRINDIVKQKESYIATGNIQAQERADEAIAKLQEYNNNLIFKKVELALSYGQEQRAQDTSDFEIAGSLPSGTTWTSPTTGKVYTGIASPTTETQAFTDNDGNVTIIDKNTGKTIGTIAGIGASKAKNIEFKEVNGKIFTFDPETGNLKDSGITVPKQSTGGGGGISSTSLGGDYNTIKSQLEATRGDDGYVNTDKYKELRTSAKDKTSFDKNFSYLLNPNDASAQSFLKEESTATNQELKAGVWSWLASSEANSLSEEQKAQEIMANGFNPEDFGIYR